MYSYPLTEPYLSNVYPAQAGENKTHQMPIQRMLNSEMEVMKLASSSLMVTPIKKNETANFTSFFFLSLSKL
jgi:hypothetical protein